MSRPGGDPIFTLEVKRAAGGAKRPHFSRHPSDCHSKRVSAEWRSLFVGLTYWRLDYGRLALGDDIVDLLEEWEHGRDEDDITKRRRMGIELVARTERQLKRDDLTPRQDKALWSLMQQICSEVFGITNIERKPL